MLPLESFFEHTVTLKLLYNFFSTNYFSFDFQNYSIYSMVALFSRTLAFSSKAVTHIPPVESQNQTGSMNFRQHSSISTKQCEHLEQLAADFLQLLLGQASQYHFDYTFILQIVSIRFEQIGVTPIWTISSFNCLKLFIFPQSAWKVTLNLPYSFLKNGWMMISDLKVELRLSWSLYLITLKCLSSTDLFMNSDRSTATCLFHTTTYIWLYEIGSPICIDCITISLFPFKIVFQASTDKMIATTVYCYRELKLDRTWLRRLQLLTQRGMLGTSLTSRMQESLPKTIEYLERIQFFLLYNFCYFILPLDILNTLPVCSIELYVCANQLKKTAQMISPALSINQTLSILVGFPPLLTKSLYWRSITLTSISQPQKLSQRSDILSKALISVSVSQYGEVSSSLQSVAI